MKKLILGLLLLLTMYACTQFSVLDTIDTELEDRLRALAPNNSLSYYVLPESNDYANIPQDPNNPLTEEKVELGKMLFFETGLGTLSNYAEGRQTYSCSTCHVPRAGYLPGRAQGIADGAFGFGSNGEYRETFSTYKDNELDIQGARPLSVLNVAFVTNSTWSGKFGANYVNVGTEYAWSKEEATMINHLGMDGLESQNIEGLKIHRMAVDLETVVELGYKDMFDAAFPDFQESERYSLMTASFAISAYLRSLLTTQAPYQMWLKGDKSALTERQKKGAMLFFGKAGCYRCHQGPALNAVKFYALGVSDLFENSDSKNTDVNDIRNFGRGGFTGKKEDLYKFKVPQLYNLKYGQFFFHGSSKSNMWGVIEYFNKGIPENPRVPLENIATEFHPLNLTTFEVDALVDFMEEGLYDPDLERYVPQEVLSGNCFPNNDSVSRKDLGCN